MFVEELGKHDIPGWKMHGVVLNSSRLMILLHRAQHSEASPGKASVNARGLVVIATKSKAFSPGWTMR